MGFSKPKDLPPPTPAPPPVRSTGAEVMATVDATRRRAMARKGYDATLIAQASPVAPVKKTLLGQ